MGNIPEETKARKRVKGGYARSIRFDDREDQRLRALADRWHCSLAAAVRRAVAVAAEREFESGGATDGARLAPAEAGEAADALWEKIDGLIAQVPAREFALLPEDGAEEHDHYIYGTRKRGR